MNRKQIISVWTGVAVCILMFLVPPWQAPQFGNAFQGYHLTSMRSNGAIESVGIPLLLVQWLLAVLVTGAAVVTCAERKQ